MNTQRLLAPTLRSASAATLAASGFRRTRRPPGRPDRSTSDASPGSRPAQHGPPAGPFRATVHTILRHADWTPPGLG
jgi:hypothetical protein